jgi:hypothetical protein
MIITEDNMDTTLQETRSPVKFGFKTIFFFEAKIARKDEDSVFKILTTENIRQLENDINIWLKCGNYKVLSIDKVERQQVSIL